MIGASGCKLFEDLKGKTKGNGRIMIIFYFLGYLKIFESIFQKACTLAPKSYFLLIVLVSYIGCNLGCKLGASGCKLGASSGGVFLLAPLLILCYFR